MKISSTTEAKAMEEKMKSGDIRAARPHQVTAAYEGSVVSFLLATGATFGDLAEYLAKIEERQGRRPIAIDVKLDA